MFENLSLATIKTLFIEEIELLGGTVSDTFEDESRLFIRSILPKMREVGPEDQVKAGVALRASGPDISVSPYIFRVICSNGAIMAHVLDTQHIVQPEMMIVSEIETALRSTIQMCGSEDLFVAAAEQMQAARDMQPDLALSMMPHLSRLSRTQIERVMDVVFNQWAKSNDRSRFGLMNAITALARDTADPEARWRLEELGARIGIPALSPVHADHPTHARREVAKHLELA
jgi:hypothetical protein